MPPREPKFGRKVKKADLAASRPFRKEALEALAIPAKKIILKRYPEFLGLPKEKQRMIIRWVTKGILRSDQKLKAQAIEKFRRIILAGMEISKGMKEVDQLVRFVAAERDEDEPLN